MKNFRFSLVAMIMVAIVIFQACKKKDEGNNPTPAPTPVPALDAKDFTASLDENPEKGKVLGTLDAHKSETVVYSLANESVAGAIEINAKGEVLVNDETAFNFEVNPTITADYIVKDGEAEGKGKITITINKVEKPFIMTVHTYQEKGKNVIMIPIFEDQTYNYTYDYDIDWGDGTVEKDLGGYAKHDYASAGVYTIKITGTFPAIQFGNTRWSLIKDVAKQVQSIDAWGDIKWKNMNNAFRGCIQMNIKASDVPDLSECTDATRMFLNCQKLNADLSKWDVSKITNMKGMFELTLDFEGDLTGWEVSQVTECKCFANKSKMTKKPNLTCNTTCNL